LDPAHGEPGVAEGTVDDGEEPINGGGGGTEEVEIACLPFDVAACDECRAACEREAFRFLEAGDDRRDLLLKRAQHLRVDVIALEPARPGASDRRRKDELVP